MGEYMGSRGIGLFLTSAQDAVRGQLHAQAALPRETIQMPTEQGAGWAVEPVWTSR